MYTGYYDHTGARLNVGDRCTVDSGHSNSEDESGVITYKEGKGCYFSYDSNCDEVPLHQIHTDLEKQSG